MLIVEIGGVPATSHPTAHLFVEEGFATTAMGLQARITPRPRAESTADGIGIAGSRAGGTFMADTPRSTPEHAGNSSESEHDTVRSSNDRDQAAERDGIETEHNRGYDEATRGRRSEEQEDLGDVDPDSAESDNDRDDALGG
jgi:hypothetical protein